MPVLVCGECVWGWRTETARLLLALAAGLMAFVVPSAARAAACVGWHQLDLVVEEVQALVVEVCARPLNLFVGDVLVRTVGCRAHAVLQPRACLDVWTRPIAPCPGRYSCERPPDFQTWVAPAVGRSGSCPLVSCGTPLLCPCCPPPSPSPTHQPPQVREAALGVAFTVQSDGPDPTSCAACGALDVYRPSICSVCASLRVRTLLVSLSLSSRTLLALFALDLAASPLLLLAFRVPCPSLGPRASRGYYSW